ncbi:MAG: hypothetical protein Q9181_008281 [Wetmoreana brouardii]
MPQTYRAPLTYLRENTVPSKARMRQARRWLMEEQQKPGRNGLANRGHEDFLKWTRNPGLYAFVKLDAYTELDETAKAAIKRFKAEREVVCTEQERRQDMRDWWREDPRIGLKHGAHGVGAGKENLLGSGFNFDLAIRGKGTSGTVEDEEVEGYDDGSVEGEAEVDEDEMAVDEYL